MKKKYTYLIVIFLTVSSCITFSRITNNDFVNIDDGKYITENYYVKAGFNKESIHYATVAIVGGNWHPLVLISHMVDWSLFGTNASGHHLVSLLLHICTVIILFFFLKKTTNNLWPAAFAAAFFALHPLRVESVAWAAERKDVLSMLFGMGTLHAYAYYAEKTNFSRYFLCLLLFIMALMSKPMMVTLPFLLLLLDYWPLKRWQRAFNEHGQRFKSIEGLIWEKVPFLCLAMVATIIAFWAQSKDEFVVSLDSLPFITRTANVFVSYISYLGKIFWPMNLALLYPYYYLPLWKILISALIVILVTILVFYHVKKLPFLFVGWFWYLGTLVPVIGLIQLSVQSIADRYTYLPSIGIAIMLGWGVPLLFSHKDISKKILLSFATAFLIILSVLTWKQCGYWKNSVTLFKHSILVTKDNYLAHNSLGYVLYEEGKIGEAIDNYNKAIRLKPDAVDAYNNRGIAYSKLDRYEQAIEDFNEAIHLKPNYATAYNNRGIIYCERGKHYLAIEDFNKTIHLNSAYADAYNNRGFTYFNLNQYQQAIEDFNNVIRLKPYYTNAYVYRGVTYLLQGNKILGCRDAQKACVLGNCKTLESAKAIGLCR